MKRLIPKAVSALVLSGILGIIGCGGSTENRVAAPPEHPPTAEELEAQSQEYAAQEKKLRERDRRN